MKKLAASHTHHVYLKPGEVFVSRKPVLISTVLGSCVAITMYSAFSNFGAICHAMLPDNAGKEKDLRYVDTALQYISDNILKYRINIAELDVKLFGGAQVLDVGYSSSAKCSIGDLNVAKAESVLADMGFNISARDTGGFQGRKLFFCTRSGDVFMRKMRDKHHISHGDISA